MLVREMLAAVMRMAVPKCLTTPSLLEISQISLFSTVEGADKMFFLSHRF